MTDAERPTSTDQLDQTADGAPTPELPAADAAPTGPPLTHHEPAAAHAPGGGHGADSHAIDAHAADGHAADPHGGGGHGDGHAAAEHGHGDVRLGPIDWAGWAYAALGVVVGVVVVAAFWLAIS
jgi:hypothetical protein